jgi:putative endonuclease
VVDCDGLENRWGCKLSGGSNPSPSASLRCKNSFAKQEKCEGCPPKLLGEGGPETIKMFYVYLLQSAEFPEQRYIGFTTDLKSRIKTHNGGGSTHTAKYRPWKLTSYHAFADENRAREFEHYLKSGSGRAFTNKRLRPAAD